MAQNNAGVKFSQLPEATYPLVGDEVMCLAQEGVSRKATVAQIFAGGAAGRVVYVSPAGVSNDVTPPGFGDTTRFLDVDTSAGAAQWTGLVPGFNGQRIIVTPIAINTLRLDALAGGSAAAYQFRAALNTNLLRNLSLELEYCLEVAKWLVIP